MRRRYSLLDALSIRDMMLRDYFSAGMVQPPPLYTSSIAPNGTEEAPSQSIEGMAKAHGAAAALSPDGGYTSDTHDEGRPQEKEGDGRRFAATDQGPKPVGRHNSLSDHVSEWVSSIDSESLCIAEEEDVAVDDQSKDLTDYVARPRPIVAGEESGRSVEKGKQEARKATSDASSSTSPCGCAAHSTHRRQIIRQLGR
ncbi:uncharacterized protein LOC119353853 isoform X2 [Triticum dicoccoides]|uniref:Uncharacterized protein n=1 Tax=Triticum turgidum subsp. durum TaxID=4567 RepID=A0A9R1NNN3_TRITD|nr:uncharacterized protein LOC119353853 isoform X2 [Triticum dicoccoides]VAH28148.1 unnamed protein product [Triticum turgidum subsp. durum]